jgi:hypothetical protein
LSKPKVYIRDKTNTNQTQNMTQEITKSHEIECKNCQTIFEGKYCPNCGQKSNTHRLTWHQLFHDLQHQILHVDRGIFFTLREMTLRPDKVIKEFIAGHRIKYFHPISYLLLGSALSLFIMKPFKEQLLQFVTSGAVGQQSAQQAKMQTGVFNYMQDHYNLMLAIFIPFLAFCTWLVYRKQKQYNYVEHMVVFGYTMGHSSYLTFLITPLLLVIKAQWFFGITSLVSYSYMLWVLFRVFRQPTIGKTIWKLVQLVLLLIGLYLLAIIIMVAILLVLKFVFHLDVLHIPSK